MTEYLTQQEKIIFKDFLTVRELMLYMGVGHEQITKWVYEGLPQYRFGNRVLYNKQDLYEFMQRFKFTTEK
jgi:excisionase family DNA binding protein